MRINRSKLLKLAAASAAGLALVQSTLAATVLTGLTDTNQAVPSDHGSNAPETQNITLTWDADWDQYDGWPNDPGDGVYQHDHGLNDPHTIVFTPDAGWSVVLAGLDLNVWGGGGETTVDWEVTGSISGSLGSGTWTTPDGANTTFPINITGASDEELTLSLVQTSGAASYLAIDNLAFDQVSSDIPAIASFTSDKEYIDNPLTLSWTITNPSPTLVLTLDDGSGPVDVTSDTNLTTGEGSRQVSPATNTTYTLTLDGGNSMDLTVLLGEALSLDSDTNLVASAPYEATLTWEVRPTDAALITLSDGTGTIDVTADTDPLTGQGSRTVTVPDPSTTFTIDANESGNTQSVLVMRAAENSAAFSLDSTTVFDGNPVTVTWNGTAGNPDSWIGIYTKTKTPGNQNSDQWNYLNGTHTADPEGSPPITSSSTAPARTPTPSNKVPSSSASSNNPSSNSRSPSPDPAMKSP